MRRLSEPVRIYLSILGCAVLLVVTLMALIYVGNRIDFTGDGDRPEVSERQKAVDAATRPCPGGRARSVKVDEGDVDFDVTVLCAARATP